MGWGSSCCRGRFRGSRAKGSEEETAKRGKTKEKEIAVSKQLSPRFCIIVIVAAIAMGAL